MWFRSVEVSFQSRFVEYCSADSHLVDLRSRYADFFDVDDRVECDALMREINARESALWDEFLQAWEREDMALHDAAVAAYDAGERGSAYAAKVNARSLGTDDFDLRGDRLLDATKKIRADRDRHFRGEPMDNPQMLVSYLVKTLKEKAAQVIETQLGKEFLRLLPKKQQNSIVNADDLEQLLQVCREKMPPVKAHQEKLYVYESGKYRGIDDHDFKVLVRKSFDGLSVMFGSETNPQSGLRMKHIEEIVSWYQTQNDSELCTEELVLFRNGYLLDDELHPSTPDLFAIGGPDCDYNPRAKCPEWLKFLDAQWHDDPASVALLQELMGLYLVDDIDHHTIAALYGTGRSGKGTIIRVIRRLVGEAYETAFSVTGLTGSFGLAGMLGKTLATCGDARGPWRSDVRAAARETILQITGGDAVEVNRKYKGSLPMQLRVRLLMSFNYVDDLITLLMDGKGSTAARLRVLKFSQSFAGREDRGLEDRLIAELPGIAVWAIDGLARLRRQGFTMNDATVALRNSVKTTTVGEFLQDHEPEFPVSTAVLYNAYREWCKGQGIDKPVVQKFFVTQVKDAMDVEYTENSRRCTTNGCKERHRYFFRPARDVSEALQQNFTCPVCAFEKQEEPRVF